MSVIQRCPSCGTTQNTPGECEACHESAVRFYCTNHEPGLWLDGRTCPTCAARRPAATRPPLAHRPRPVPAPAPAPVPAPAARTRPAPPTDTAPVWLMPEARGPGDALDRGDIVRPPAEMAFDRAPSREPGWMTALRGLALARTAASKALPATRTLGLIGTFVKRVLLIGVFLVAAAVFALYLLLRDL